MVVNPVFFEMTDKQRLISAFGRKMVDFQEAGGNSKTPIAILNDFSRVGELMADTASMKRLDARDLMVVKYARMVM
jgi:hypothetical protein